MKGAFRLVALSAALGVAAGVSWGVDRDVHVDIGRPNAFTTFDRLVAVETLRVKTHKISTDLDPRESEVLLRDPLVTWVNTVHTVPLHVHEATGARPGDRIFMRAHGWFRPPPGTGPVPDWYSHSVDLDLDADSDRTGVVEGTLSEDQAEETPPGALVCVDPEWQCPKDLVVRRVMPPQRPQGKVILRKIGGAGEIEVRKGGPGGEVILSAAIHESRDLWPETSGGDLVLKMVGVEDKEGEVLLQVEYTSGALQADQSYEDRLVVTVVSVKLTGLFRGHTGDSGMRTSPAGKTCFSYNADEQHPRAFVGVEGRITPALPAKTVKELLGESVRFTSTPVDDSHGAQERVDMLLIRKVNDTTSGLNFEDPLQGGAPGNDAYGYDPSTGTFRTWVAFKGLPRNNSDFGPKKAIFEYSCGGETPKRLELDYKLFFERNARNHHDDAAASENARSSENWYYYWSQDRKGSRTGVCEYHYDGSNPETNWGISPKTSKADGEYQPANKRIVLYSIAGNRTRGANSILAFPTGWLVRRELRRDKEKAPRVRVKVHWACDTAPEWVNIVHNHEYTHHRSWYSSSKPDKDGDNVPDEWEDGLGLNYEFGTPEEKRDSFPSFRGSRTSGGSRDFEFYAWAAAAFSPAYGGVYRLQEEVEVEERLPNGKVVKRKVWRDRPAQFGCPAPTQANNHEDWTRDGSNWIE